MSFKKTLHASEQERADVAKERAEWQDHQPALDVTKLVFIDETGASTNMTRLRGRSPKGERCHASVPGGHWHTTTCIAGLRVGAVTAPMVLDGPMDKDAFLVYVRQCLCPALHAGDIVIADNLGSHKNDAVRAAIEGSVPPSAICRRTPRTSTQSKWCSPSSKPCSKAAHRTVERYGTKLEHSSTPSRPRNAPTTSNRQGMCLLKCKML